MYELECTEGVQASAEITEDLDTDTDRKGDRAEGLPEFEPVVTCRGLDELWKTLGVFAPVELTTVDDDTSDGGAMSTNPFSGGSNDNVGSCFVSDIFKFKGKGGNGERLIGVK